MTVETPLWLQNEDYSAREDRQFIERVMHSADRVFDGLAVAQTGAGDFTITVDVGAAAILGNDTAAQGMYYVGVTAPESVAVPATPGSGSRTDLVVLQVNDAQAGGAAGDNATIEVLEGTTVAPASAIPLATIARSNTEGAILDAAITDVRPLGTYPYTVSASAPPSGIGVEGDLWVQVT